MFETCNTHFEYFVSDVFVLVLDVFVLDVFDLVSDVFVLDVFNISFGSLKCSKQPLKKSVTTALEICFI